MHLITRAQWGARSWRKPNGSIRYAGPRRGVKIHYLGTTYSSRQHEQCPAFVRQLQAQHMDANGWSDIGYSHIVCEHGTAYEGRGLQRRNSANGNTSLNEQHYAVLAVHGTSGRLSDALLSGLRDAIEYCRANGPAGAEILGHRDGHPTQCPGDELYAWVRAGAPRPQEDDIDTDTLQEIARYVWRAQDINPAPVDGERSHWMATSYLRDSNRRLRRLQGEVAATHATVRTLADALAARDDAIDPDALVARIEHAISGVRIRLHLDDEDTE